MQAFRKFLSPSFLMALCTFHMADASTIAGGDPAPAAKPAKKEVELTPVKMDDGRIVDFSGTVKAMKSFTVVEATVVGRIDFRNGKTVNLTVEDPDLLLVAAAHGLGQKLGDSYAALKDEDEAYQTCATLAERIARDGAAGWNRPSAGGGEAGLGLLVQALVEVTGNDAATVRAYLDTQTNEVKKAFREQDAIVSPVYMRLKAERDAKKPQPKVDTSAALAGLAALAKKADA